MLEPKSRFVVSSGRGTCHSVATKTVKDLVQVENEVIFASFAGRIQIATDHFLKMRTEGVICVAFVLVVVLVSAELGWSVGVEVTDSADFPGVYLGSSLTPRGARP